MENQIIAKPGVIDGNEYDYVAKTVDDCLFLAEMLYGYIDKTYELSSRISILRGVMRGIPTLLCRCDAEFDDVEECGYVYWEGRYDDGSYTYFANPFFLMVGEFIYSIETLKLFTGRLSLYGDFAWPKGHPIAAFTCSGLSGVEAVSNFLSKIWDIYYPMLFEYHYDVLDETVYPKYSDKLVAWKNALAKALLDELPEEHWPYCQIQRELSLLECQIDLEEKTANVYSQSKAPSPLVGIAGEMAQYIAQQAKLKGKGFAGCSAAEIRDVLSLNSEDQVRGIFNLKLKPMGFISGWDMNPRCKGYFPPRNPFP